MFATLTRSGSSSSSSRSSLITTKTVSTTLLASSCPIFLQLKNHAALPSEAWGVSGKINPDQPPLTRAMKKPIPTGRFSKTKGNDVKDVVPNPFRGRALPFGRRTIWESKLDEDLATGKHWIGKQLIDRFGEINEFDLFQRAWGNEDYYRNPAWKPPYIDITNQNDMDFQFKIHNLGVHVDMVAHIPHLKPLLPEIRAKYRSLTAKYSDIVAQAIDNKESGYVSNTSIVTDWREGTEVQQNQKKEIELMTNGDKDEKRKYTIKKKIHYETIKKFVDDKVDEHEWVKLIFVDAAGSKHYVYGMVGETLLQCCRRYAIPIDGYCNGYDRGFIRVYGEGAWCSQCQMDISPKYFHLIPAYDWREREAFMKFKEITPTSRLGCCIWIRNEFDGMIVNIPKSLFMPYGNWDE